ncbi:MAG: hypothetical protein E7B43_03990 [Streptococcus sp.]|nr:hypothetical protein [Streptococcus sp.]
MFKQVMKKIGVIVLALTLLILDLTLLGAFPLLTQDGKLNSYRLKRLIGDVSLRLLLLISSSFS